MARRPRGQVSLPPDRSGREQHAAGQKKPSAEAIVELPPGELDKLRLNYQELQQAADSTVGRYYTLSNANNLLDDLPMGPTLAISLPVPPTLLWNHWLVFVGVLFLITSEWILRKFKHLL